jgi:hypothetical protein
LGLFTAGFECLKPEEEVTVQIEETFLLSIVKSTFQTVFIGLFWGDKGGRHLFHAKMLPPCSVPMTGFSGIKLSFSISQFSGFQSKK